MSKLNSSSTTKRIKSATWLDWVCLRDKSGERSCDESMPMIVQDGKLKKISGRKSKSHLSRHSTFCKCCCNLSSKDTGVDSDSEMVFSECLSLRNEQVEVELSDSSMYEDWKNEEIDKIRRSLESPSPYSPSTRYAPESPTPPPSSVHEDPSEVRYHSHYVDENVCVEDYEISSGSDIQSVRTWKPRDKMCRIVSSKCSHDEEEIHSQYLESDCDVEIDVTSKKDENNIVRGSNRDVEGDVTCDTDTEIFSPEEDCKSIENQSEMRESVNGFGSSQHDHPVESNDSSDGMFDNRWRTKKRGGRSKGNVVLSLWRSLSRRRTRSRSREDDESVSKSVPRDDRTFTIQNSKCLESSSVDSIPYCARNRRSIKHKRSAKRNSKIIEHGKLLSKSVPNLNDSDQHQIVKYHSEKSLDKEKESKGVETAENRYARGDNTENEITLCCDTETRDVSTNSNQTYFIHESVQCNMSDDAKGNNVKEDFLPLNEMKRQSEIHTSGNTDLHEETQTTFNLEIDLQDDPVIAIATSDGEDLHYFIPKPLESKSEESFFMKFDPTIHKIYKDKEQRKLRNPLRETESCFHLQNILDNPKDLTLLTQSNIKSDTESQTGDELTELLKDVSVGKINQKENSLVLENEKSGFTKPSRTFSSPGDRQSYGASESHLQEADTTIAEEPPSKNTSKKKHTLMWRISNIFKKRRSRSRGVTEKGLPQIHCSPVAPAVAARAAAVRGPCSRHSSPGTRAGGSISGRRTSKRLAAGSCRKRPSVARHPATVATSSPTNTPSGTATTRRRNVATGPRHRHSAAEIGRERKVCKRRNHTLPFLILDTDEFEARVAHNEREAERRSRMTTSLQSPRRFCNEEDRYCPWKEFQTWR